MRALTMAYAPATASVAGSFVEKDYGHTFEYSLNPDIILSPPAHGGKNVRFPHIVWVGDVNSTRSFRYALVKGSVVHIITDETTSGWVVEKWDIKKHRKFIE